MTRFSERSEQPHTIMLPLDEVVVPIDHIRRVHNVADLERLATSIDDVGLLMPIAVTPASVLIFGSRRIAAVKMLGWQHIEARVFDSADDPELRRLMAWEENETRQNLSLEEQLAFKREVLDPLLRSRTRARRGDNAASNRQRLGLQSEVGKLPTASEPLAGPPVATATGPTPAGVRRRITCDQTTPVPSREVVGHYLHVSARTIEKFEHLARWSEDEALPEPIRAEAVRARERANALGKVDGEYKRVRALVESRQAAPRDELLEVEHQLTRVFNALDKLIDDHPANTIGADISTGVWRGIATALQHVFEWGREIRAVRDDQPR